MFEKQASLIDFYPFLPQNTSPLMGYLEYDTKSLWALVPVSFKGQESSELEIEVEMIDEARCYSIPIDWRIIDSHDVESAANFLLVGIGLLDLDPGVFRLEFTVTDPNTYTQAWIPVLLKRQ